MNVLHRISRASLPTLIATAIVVVSGTAVATTTTFDLSSMTVGANYLVGDSINTATATINFKAFQFANGTWTSNGVATVVATNYAQGSGSPELNLDQIMVQVVPDTNAYAASFQYADLGGQINLGVNGSHANEPDFMDLDGTTLGNCYITVTETSFAGGVRGTVTITPQVGYDIDKFGIGGKDVRVDDVTFSF